MTENSALVRRAGFSTTQPYAVDLLEGPVVGELPAEETVYCRFELAFHKLAPGGHIVLETLNPACWIAFFESYIRDITHVRPLHPETLKFLVVAAGFVPTTPS